MGRITRTEAKRRTSKEEVDAAIKKLFELYPMKGRLSFRDGAYGSIWVTHSYAATELPIRDAILPPYA